MLFPISLHGHRLRLTLHGIIFGSNARLDINGSFLATTANSFQFPGGTQFRASITVNGTITNRQPDGLVLLTNQFQPNTAAGNIVVSNINTSSNNSGSILIDSRGNFTPTGNLEASTLGDERAGDIVSLLAFLIINLIQQIYGKRWQASDWYFCIGYRSWEKWGWVIGD